MSLNRVSAGLALTLILTGAVPAFAQNFGEWQKLLPGANGAAVMPGGAEAHAGPVESVAVSPDGAWFATAGFKTVNLWDAKTGKLVRTLKGHLSPVHVVAFSPDSKLVASGSGTNGNDKNNIKLWDVETGTLKQELSQWRSDVKTLAFSPDGKFLASTGYGGASVYELASGSEQTVNMAPDQTVSFSPNGKTLAVCNVYEVQLWDVATSKKLKAFRHKDFAQVYACTYSPDGKLVAAIGRDGLAIWDVATGQARHVVKLGGGQQSVAFSRDGKTLAVGGYNSVQVVQVAGAKVLKKFTLANRAFGGETRSVAFTSDGAKVIAPSGNILQLWAVNE
jgi:WD40 repeat protein